MSEPIQSPPPFADPITEDNPVVDPGEEYLPPPAQDFDESDLDTIDDADLGGPSFTEPITRRAPRTQDAQ